MLRKYLINILKIRTFLFFNIIIFIAKIIYSFYTNFTINSFEDFSIAYNLAKYGIYSEFLEVGSTAYKLPIYPLFLSSIIYLFPKSYVEIIILFQHLFYFFIPVLIIKITKIFDAEKIGLITAYLFILSPAYFYYSNIIEVTNIFIPILLIWIYFYSKIYKKIYNSNYYFILFSLITAILFLTQVIIIPLALFLILFLIISKKIVIKNLFLIAILSSVFYSPWIIRNYFAFDRFIPTKTPVWQNIYLSYTPMVNLLDKVKVISSENEKKTFQMRKHISEFEMEKMYKRETLYALKGKEEIIPLKMAQNILLIWYVPSRYFYDNSFNILFGRKIFLIFFNILTIISLYQLFKRNKKLFFLSILVFINFTFPYTIGHAANTRFKLDFEWYQYFLVACLFYNIYEKRIETKKSET